MYVTIKKLNSSSLNFTRNLPFYTFYPQKLKMIYFLNLTNKTLKKQTQLFCKKLFSRGGGIIVQVN